MHAQKQGAVPTNNGVRFTTWAPIHDSVSAVILDKSGNVLRETALEKVKEGYHTGLDSLAHSGDWYQYRLDFRLLPDPASRFQLLGVHGPSQVCSAEFGWKHNNKPAPPPEEWIIYELHIGGFSPEGTFLSAIPKLGKLRELGITAVEIMPVGDFAGDRNWGYDGVLPFAPARCYGSPDDFKTLIDAAHGLGLAVILDVIYNHIGPAGNYFEAFSPWYFTDKHRSFWGKGLNFDDQKSSYVRAYFIHNAIYWAEEFHIDGVRLDSTHSIVDTSHKHILTEISEALHQRGVQIIAEDERNLANLFTDKQKFREGFDGVWADDFHHSVRVALTGENHSHFASFKGSAPELAELLDHGWLFCGSHYPHWKKPRGSSCKHLPPASFVHYISNHDQAGNRPRGERLHHLVSPEAYRAVSALLCLGPFTPMFFMGQEWGCSTPFLFFTDHDPDLGAKIAPSRKQEFEQYGCKYSQEVLELMPDPQDLKTFEMSRLIWEEIDQPLHAKILDLHRECLRLRKLNVLRKNHSRESWKVYCLASKAVAILYGRIPSEQQLVLSTVWPPFHFSLDDIGLLKPGGPWRLVLASNDSRFGGEGEKSFDEQTQTLHAGIAQTWVFARQSL